MCESKYEMKIGVAAELNTETIKKANSLRVDGLVFHRIHAKVTADMLANFDLHDTSKLSMKGKEYAYAAVEQQLNKIEEIAPKALMYARYNLKMALLKDMYWSLIIDNLNAQKCLELKQPGFVFVPLDSQQSKFVGTLKFFLRLTRSFQHIRQAANVGEIKNKLAIRINSAKALPFFGNLLQTLGKNNFVCFQSDEVQSETPTSKMLAQMGFTCACLMAYPAKANNEILPMISLFYKVDIDFLNLLIDTKRKLKTKVDIYETLALSGVTGFLQSAGENEGEGVIAGLVSKKHQLKSFNFMNGTKAKDPINQFTTFDYWFVHDERMQKMLLSFSNQKKENLPVVGHLLEDTAKQHVYAGTLDKWKEQLKNKKVIALFSSIIYNQERGDVASFLHQFLDNNPDVIVLIRQHPSETQQVAYSHERSIVLPDFKELSGAALFDLLDIAHVAISFGSTVSLQASWFAIPSATVEYAEKSLLLYVDEIKVHHINSIKNLEKFVLDALSRPKLTRDLLPNEKSVAQKMADYLVD
jgi:hypothetical protein